LVAREAANPASRQCDVVIDLFSGPMGICRLGYLKSGADAGRSVLLREVSPQSLRFLGRRLRKASEIAHSSLLKLLGTVEVDGRVQIASEYIAGVSLFELRAAALETRERLEPAIATRIILRALDAAKSAHTLCQAKGFELTRSIFSDTVWVAEFGDTMLTDVGIADLLGAGKGASAIPTQLVGSGSGSHDVYAAGSELYELLTGKPFHGGIPSFDAATPRPIAGIVSRALAFDEKLRFASISDMTTAFQQLPRELVAHEDQVTTSIERLMKPSLKLRRAKLAVLERMLGSQDEGEPTRCYSVASLLDVNQSETVRPMQGAANDHFSIPELGLPGDLISEAASGAFLPDDINAVPEQEEEEATRIMRPLALAPPEVIREVVNPEAKLPTIHVAELVTARRAVTVMMRTPLVGAEDQTLQKPQKPQRRLPLIAICVLTVLAAILALAAFGPRRLSDFLRADHATAPKR
jgi:serine/threonine protein kinase